MNKLYKVAILIGSALISLAGCSRPENQSSRLEVSIPALKQNAVSPMSANLVHVVVNVTGPNMSPIFFDWDRHNGTSVPAKIEINDIPTGSDRLIQVLAVYEDGANRRMDFHYGDVTQSLVKASEDVTIHVDKINHATDVLSGSISGRYVNSVSAGSDQGPSGEVLIKFLPPNNKPPLVLEKSIIMNGWFNFFGLSNIPLLYEVIEGKQVLFGGPVHLGNFEASQKTARSMIPVYKYTDQGNIESINLEPELHILGFFGDNALTNDKKVCYTSGEPVQGLHQYNLPISDGSRLTFTNTYPSGTPPTIAQLRSTTSPLNIIFGDGGESSVTTNCNSLMASTATNLYSAFLGMNSTLFGRGREQMGGFRAPFGMVDPQNPANYKIGGEPLVLTAPTGNITFSGKLLPGLTSLVTGIVAYKLNPPIPGAPYPHDEVACAQLQQGAYGATHRGEAAPSIGGAFVLETQIPIASMNDGSTVGICFRGPKGLYSKGAVLHMNGGGGGGGGGGLTHYLRLEPADTSSGYDENSLLLTRNVCHPMRFKSYNNGSDYAVTTETTIANLPNSGDLVFYSTTDCAASTEVSTVIIPDGQNYSETVYVRGTITAPALTINPSISGDSNLGFSPVGNPIKIGNPRLFVEHPYYVNSDACLPYRIHTQYANKHPYSQIGADLAVNVMIEGVTPTFFSNEDNCRNGSPSTNSTITNGYGFVTRWIKASGITGNFPMVVSYSGWEGITATPYRLAATYSEDASNLRMILREYPEVGKCVPVRLALVNSAGSEVVSRNGTEFNISANELNATFHNDSKCHSALAIFNSIPMGESAKEFYMRPLNTLPINFKLGQHDGVPLYFDSPPSAGIATNYITFTPPQLDSKIMGSSHFFNHSILLSVPVGATLSCQRESSGTWSPCPVGTITGNTFNWTANDAVQNYRYQIASNVIGEPTARMVFDTYLIYGPDFKVYNCGAYLENNVDASEVQTALSGNDNVCFGSSLAITCDAPINIGHNQNLIGHPASKTQVNLPSSTNISCMNIEPSSATGGQATIANFNFDLKTGGCAPSGSQVGISVTSGIGGAPFLTNLVNNLFEIETKTGCTAKGISVYNNYSSATVSIIDSTINISGDNPGAIGLYTANNHAGPLNFTHNQIMSSTPDFNTTMIVHDRVTGGSATSTMRISQNLVSGPRLILFDTLNTATTVASTFEFTRNNIDLGAEPITSNIMNFTAGSNHKFAGNRVKFNQASSSYAFLSVSSTQSLDFSVHQNRFVHLSEGHVFSTNVQSAQTSTFYMNQNSFLSTSTSSGNDSLVVSGGGSGVTNILGSGFPDLSWRNRVCETDISNGWINGDAFPVNGSTITQTVETASTPTDYSCY